MTDCDMIAEMRRRLELSMPLVKKIKDANKGTDESGTDVCPLCEGTIHWWIAGSYNSHVGAKCETEGCLGFQE